MIDAEAFVDRHSQFISVDEMRVHFKREGRGPTIVLLHGSGSSLHCFDQVVATLASSCDVVRLDLPGFGLTGPRPDRDYRIESYVSFLEHFVSALMIGRFSIAGNSLGGNIAWNFALDYPERVQRLILMNATGYPEKSLPAAMRLMRNPVARALLRRWMPRSATARNLRKVVGSRMAQIDDSMIDRVHALVSRPGNRGAFIDLANTSQRDRSAEICKVKAPTLVLRGESVDGQHFVRDIPGSREIVYEGVGHLLPDEAPIDVAKAIRSHLDSL
jgi:pimeloyl-ACP methyl ester carboxylesterase